MLEVRKLKKKFGKNIVLKEMNLKVEKGDRLAIIGPSGCGKSTFLRCLNLLETPSGGEIIFEDEYLFKLFSLYTKEEILQLKAIIREQKKKGEDFSENLNKLNDLKNFYNTQRHSFPSRLSGQKAYTQTFYPYPSYIRRGSCPSRLSRLVQGLPISTDPFRWANHLRSAFGAVPSRSA